MTRKAKAKALEKDWAKVNEGSPVQDDEIGMKTPEKYPREEEDMTKIDEGKQIEETSENSDAESN